MYEMYTKEFLQNRMLGRIKTDIDKSEGSFTFDAIAPAAVELAQTYIELDGILEKAFAQTSYGEWLIKRAEEYGVSRKSGTRAYGAVTFYGADGTVVPEGTLVQTEAGLQYETAKEITISQGCKVVNISAVSEGTQYNIPAKTINQLPVQLTGITKVENTEPIAEGRERETESDFLQRLLLKVRKPATSGNENHYRQWALEVPGIGDSKVFPLWKGAGTVKVIVVDSNRQPLNPEGELLKTVRKYINDNRPIGADVTVESAKRLDIDITADIELEKDYSMALVLQEFRARIADYLKSITFVDEYVNFYQIGKMLVDTDGVKRCNSIMLKGGSTNIPIAVDECPYLNDVNLVQTAEQGVS
ncbi:MAG TPA: baseplate J/gp47 family protein [Ruminiclostridium sp.]|nr:baseplate J/gp47 family protein [Ruminiclostridium sp.]